MALQELENNLDHWEKEIVAASTFQELEKLKSNLVGKSGIITSAFRMMSELSTEEKKSFGEKLNKIKNSVENAIAVQKKKLENYFISEKLRKESVDITLPIENEKFGGLHIITKTMNRIRKHYLARGFEVLDGPEIEGEFFNFDALNIPKHHPARQSFDTFFLEGLEDCLLRTHTSCVQVRSMLERGANVRMISIGKTYRNDALDATHSPMFHQVEGLVVDTKPITIGHLKSELEKFISFFFETDDVAIRFRPSFFPFTEPSVEVDCKYFKENGKLILSQKGDKWLELGGAGMVHPQVFKNCGIKEQAFGFAFGFGLERLVMLKNGIQDIRNLFDTDIRWLRYYGQ